MKYLKKYNEELNISTYKSAADKLTRLGHKKRGSDLLKNAEEIKYKEIIDKYSKFGTYKLSLKSDYISLQDFVGDFYLLISIDREGFGDEVLEVLDSNGGDGVVYMWGFIGIIPVNEEGKKYCDKAVGESDDPFYMGMTVSIRIVLKDGCIKITNLFIDSYDSAHTSVTFYDRASAGRFKNLLVKMFTNKNLNYPSNYTDFDNFYDMMNNYFGAKLGLTTDYAYSPELIGDFINKTSVNTIYKSHEN